MLPGPWWPLLLFWLSTLIHRCWAERESEGREIQPEGETFPHFVADDLPGTLSRFEHLSILALWGPMVATT